MSSKHRVKTYAVRVLIAGVAAASLGISPAEASGKPGTVRQHHRDPYHRPRAGKLIFPRPKKQHESRLHDWKRPSARSTKR